ncbi:MAG: tRNA guanosine(34) transglycosylase Tgt [archaeon]
MGCFKIIARDKKTKARTGVISTKKGKIETPFFMPVATKSSVKYIDVSDLESMKCKAVISNTFILHLKPGEEFVRKLGGIGKMMNYSGINVTDSGGFQMYSESLYLSSDDSGVWFKNPFDNHKVFISPEKDMQIQIDLDSDIAMCLDTMPLLHHSKSDIERAVERTTLWAKRCKKEHDELQKKIPKNKRQLLWGICQGGVYDDLREKSAREMAAIDFDGYSIGGLALGETIEQEMQAVKIQKAILPEEKPVYLMGEGNPVLLLDAISLGVDMFDSRFPTQNARRGTLFTSKGKLRLFNSKHRLSKMPIDSDCDCFVCKKYTLAYIRNLIDNEPTTGFRLVSYHNIYYLQRLMERARAEIKKGKFLEFKNKVKKIYAKADSNLGKKKKK